MVRLILISSLIFLIGCNNSNTSYLMVRSYKMGCMDNILITDNMTKNKLNNQIEKCRKMARDYESGLNNTITK